MKKPKLKKRPAWLERLKERKLRLAIGGEREGWWFREGGEWTCIADEPKDAFQDCYKISVTPDPPPKEPIRYPTKLVDGHLYCANCLARLA